MTSKIEEAKNTCDGIGRLINRLNGAAVDLDKGGESAYEILALLATTYECVNNLSAQLEALNELPTLDTHRNSNVANLIPQTENHNEGQPLETFQKKLQVAGTG